GFAQHVSDIFDAFRVHSFLRVRAWDRTAALPTCFTWNMSSLCVSTRLAPTTAGVGRLIGAGTRVLSGPTFRWAVSSLRRVVETSLSLECGDGVCVVCQSIEEGI